MGNADRVNDEDSEAQVAGRQGPPVTGHAGIDAALAAVAELDAVDLAEHPVRLAEAHTVLRAALDDRPQQHDVDSLDAP
jgi:hypothetical protein